MPALTSDKISAVNAIKRKTRAITAAIGRTKLVIPLGQRNPRGTRSPHVRFVIETKSAANLAAVRKVVAKVLRGPANIASGVSWQNRRLIVPSAGAGSVQVNAAFDVRFLFPGADPRDQRFKLANFVVLTLPSDPLSAKKQLGGGTGSLYDLAYVIRDAGNFVRVDPEILFKGWRTERVTPPPSVQTPGTGGPGTGIPTSGMLGVIAFSSGGPAPEPIDHAWNLRKVNMPASNDALNSGGEGIRVGQVDTGTRDHPECNGIYAPVAEHGCTIDGEDDPIDPLSDALGDNPAHGIATASVLASRGGFEDFAVSSGRPLAIGTTNPDREIDNGEVTGVANKCIVVPVRSVSSVSLNVSNINLAEGVWHCIQQNVHVITISVGGLWHPWLERVISFAVFNNIIVVAAAGQIWPWVTAPAAYPDCIAATCTTKSPEDTIMDEPMRAARGTDIDIAAPGFPIWCADASRSRGNFVGTSAGTSFAAPTVAGAAALWLRHHGPAALLLRYQNGPKLAEVFRNLIQSTARVPTGWNTLESGAGIIHITNLLNAALPAAGAVNARDWTNYDASTEEDILRTQLGNPNQNVLLAALARLFNSTVAEVTARMEEFGTEVMSLLATAPGAFDELKNAVDAEAQAAQDAAQEAVDNVVDAVTDVCSDVVGTVMGWFD